MDGRMSQEEWSARADAGEDPMALGFEDRRRELAAKSPERPVCEGACGEEIPAGAGHVLLELVATMVGPGDRLFIPHRTAAVVCGPCYKAGRWSRETIDSADRRFYAYGEVPA